MATEITLDPRTGARPVARVVRLVATLPLLPPVLPFLAALSAEE